jgi:RHS repeat-associated protein
MAKVDPYGAVHYFFADHLRSVRVMTNATGIVEQESDYYPFGGERVITDTLNDPNTRYWKENRFKFTGMWRDAESDHDHTQFRMFPSNLARWLSPDPMAGDILNPQSFTCYGYVLKSPTTFVNSLGLGLCLGAEHCGDFCGDHHASAPISVHIEFICRNSRTHGVIRGCRIICVATGKLVSLPKQVSKTNGSWPSPPGGSQWSFRGSAEASKPQAIAGTHTPFAIHDHRVLPLGGGPSIHFEGRSEKWELLLHRQPRRAATLSYTRSTLAACSPLGPLLTSKLTRAPSSRDR